MGAARLVLSTLGMSTTIVILGRPLLVDGISPQRLKCPKTRLGTRVIRGKIEPDNSTSEVCYNVV